MSASLGDSDLILTMGELVGKFKVGQAVVRAWSAT